MPSVILDAVYVPEAGWRVRSRYQPGWRPKLQPELDRAKFEKDYRAWQTRRTEFLWFVVPGGPLPGMGFKEREVTDE